MSRKWERMVERNQKQINTQRSKQGKPAFQSANSSWTHTYVGRRWLMPLALIAAALAFAFLFQGLYQANWLYFVTVGLYIVLGLYHFFLRRPYLKVGKDRLATLKFGRESIIEAGSVEKITLSSGSVVIATKDKRLRTVLSKLFQLMPVEQMGTALSEFAKRNNIELEVEANKR